MEVVDARGAAGVHRGRMIHPEMNRSILAELRRPNMALQRTRCPRLRSGRSLRSLGSPLNARPFGDQIRHMITPSSSDGLNKECV
jgi:hypothetical protein